jgi:hypothetical protein
MRSCLTDPVDCDYASFRGTPPGPIARVRDADAARLSETLQPLGTIHPVAVDLLALGHHIAKIHPDAKFHSALGRKVRILGLQSGLNFDGRNSPPRPRLEIRRATLSPAEFTKHP